MGNYSLVVVGLCVLFLGISEVLGSCRDGWAEFQASCYREERGDIADWGRSWAEAQQFCAGAGAHVISLDSMQEMVFVVTDLITDKKSHDQWWTSAHKDFSTGVWYWDFGKGTKGPTSNNQMALPDMAWYSGQPDNADGVEFYAALLYKDGEWGLNDLTSAWNLRFICEYEL